MRRIKQSISELIYKVGTFLVDEVSTPQYIVFFTAVIIVFGLFYTYLTPINHGIGQTPNSSSDVSSSDVSFWIGQYFSIVTISSLGYGDMHPVGYSKILACIEVLLGLAVIGIMIAKATSRRLSYHVERLFSYNAQKRLEDIAEKFDTSRSAFSAIMPNIEKAYQSVPGQKHPSTNTKRELASSFRDIISEFQSRCVELCDYFLFETKQGNYFQVVPVDAVVRTGGAVDEALWILSQLIISLSPQARAEILDRDIRQKISTSIDSQKKVCDRVKKYATDENTLNVFQCIENNCRGVIESFLAVPEVPEELPLEQPDQILQDTDEPQNLSSGMDNE